MLDPVVIIGASRTPIGSFLGQFRDISAPSLGARAIAAAVEAAGGDGNEFDECIMGCVLTAGLGQAPARQASLGAGLDDSIGCVTINKMCGSGMKAVMDAHDKIRAGSAKAVVAGGMESMSNAPYLLERARSGYRLGHGRLCDHMFLDGLEDAYERGRLMGDFAEDCAEIFQFTRVMQDDYARLSLERAQRATRDEAFVPEITPVASGSGVRYAADQLPLEADPSAIGRLRPVFRADGTVTAANASAISDGAAAVTLTTRSNADAFGIAPRGAVVGHVTHAGPPSQFTVAPISAIRKLLEKIDWPLHSVDLFEINEAFAVVVMAAMKELSLPSDKVNVHGGACALGHPIGASGARIVVTLLHALERYDLKRGVAALCIGGGEATAVAIERMH